MSKFYAVRIGRNPGIYSTWEGARKQVDKFPGCQFKSFPTYQMAHSYLRNGPNPPSRSNYYSTSSATLIDDSDDLFTSRDPLPAAPPSSRKRTREQSMRDDYADYDNEDDYRDDDEDDDPAPVVTHNGKKSNTPMVVYTDGSCIGNGRDDAFAGIGVFFGDGDPRNICERLEGKPTNNRAELMAAIRPLEIVPPNVHLEIRTDSKYVIKGVKEWSIGWRRNGWVTKSGEPVLNVDLFKQILSLCESRSAPVTWTYVPGHSGEHGNEMANALAQRASILAANSSNGTRQ